MRLLGVGWDSLSQMMSGSPFSISTTCDRLGPMSTYEVAQLICGMSSHATLTKAAYESRKKWSEASAQKLVPELAFRSDSYMCRKFSYCGVIKGSRDKKDELDPGCIRDTTSERNFGSEQTSGLGLF